MKPVWSWLISFGSDASSLFAIALVAILQSTLRSVIGRQFDKSNKEPSTWLVRGIYVRPCVILFFCSLCLYDTKKHFCTGLHLLMIYGMGNPEWGNMGL